MLFRSALRRCAGGTAANAKFTHLNSASVVGVVHDVQRGLLPTDSTGSGSNNAKAAAAANRKLGVAAADLSGMPSVTQFVVSSVSWCPEQQEGGAETSMPTTREQVVVRWFTPHQKQQLGPSSSASSSSLDLRDGAVVSVKGSLRMNAQLEPMSNRYFHFPFIEVDVNKGGNVTILSERRTVKGAAMAKAKNTSDVDKADGDDATENGASNSGTENSGSEE